jgi:ankyrin repeat protein
LHHYYGNTAANALLLARLCGILQGWVIITSSPHSLFTTGCNINATTHDERKETALHIAAAAGHADIVVALLNKGVCLCDTQLDFLLFRLS